MEIETILRVLPKELRGYFSNAIENSDKLQEIRLRNGLPVIIRYDGEERELGTEGLCKANATEKIIFSDNHMKETVEYMSNYSMYSVEEEICRGFVTIYGGHRAGICGRTVIQEGRVKAIRNISSINLRIAHEIYGCGEKILQYIFDGEQFVNTLLISPPGAGKTTMLRDVVRCISDRGFTVGVADERSEIAAMYQGKIQNRLGNKVDVLDGCPKNVGIEMLIRSMAPDVIAVDEIGTEEDVKSLKLAAVSGCRVIATAHGKELEDVKNNPVMKSLIEEGYFKRVVCMSKRTGPGCIEGIYGE